MERFISRDPLGYVDGHGLYNGYFASHFLMDPTGKTTTPRSVTILSDDRLKVDCGQKDKIIVTWTATAGATVKLTKIITASVTVSNSLAKFLEHDMSEYKFGKGSVVYANKLVISTNETKTWIPGGGNPLTGYYGGYYQSSYSVPTRTYSKELVTDDSACCFKTQAEYDAAVAAGTCDAGCEQNKGT